MTRYTIPMYPYSPAECIRTYVYIHSKRQRALTTVHACLYQFAKFFCLEYATMTRPIRTPKDLDIVTKNP